MIKDFFNLLVEYIKENTGKTIGVVIGFIIAISILKIGLLKTTFIVLCIFLGYLIGDRIDKGESLKTIIERIFSYKG